MNERIVENKNSNEKEKYKKQLKNNSSSKGTLNNN